MGWPSMASAALARPRGLSSSSGRLAWGCFRGRAGVPERAETEGLLRPRLGPAPPNFLCILLAKASHRPVQSQGWANSLCLWTGRAPESHCIRCGYRKPLMGHQRKSATFPCSARPHSCFTVSRRPSWISPLPILKWSLPLATSSPPVHLPGPRAALENRLLLPRVQPGPSSHANPEKMLGKLAHRVPSQADAGHTEPPSSLRALPSSSRQNRLPLPPPSSSALMPLTILIKCSSPIRRIKLGFLRALTPP